MNILTADLYGLYSTETGTSLAAPHVAGGLALLLSANPNMDAATQEQALINFAVDLGASGPDDVFGHGHLDLLSALDWLATNPTPHRPSRQTSTWLWVNLSRFPPRRIRLTMA